MTNFLRGMGSIFNLFPETDYMAMVPREGEMLRQAERDVARSMRSAFEKTNAYYGLSDADIAKMRKKRKAING